MYMLCCWLVRERERERGNYIAMLTNCEEMNLLEMHWCGNDPEEIGSRKWKHWFKKFVCETWNYR
jgi:hypothetical protein